MIYLIVKDVEDPLHAQILKLDGRNVTFNNPGDAQEAAKALECATRVVAV